MTLLLVGAGRMGGALLRAWLLRKTGQILVIEPKPSAQLRKLAKTGAITLTAASALPNIKKIDACVVAVKPQILKTEAAALAAVAQAGALMISIAAGTSVAVLRQAWGPKARIIRAMPNIPGAIGRGITGLYAAKGVTEADRKRAGTLLSALGETLWVDKEDLIDAVTAVSGSGPAYVFHLVEALAEAGMAAGLSQAQAAQLARATVAGAGALLYADKASAAALRQAVTSPGGTTEAALKILMSELPGLMKRTVAAAKKRAGELR